jgi:hypothetical protein
MIRVDDFALALAALDLSLILSEQLDGAGQQQFKIARLRALHTELRTRLEEFIVGNL